jgi:hypothetical protein
MWSGFSLAHDPYTCWYASAELHAIFNKDTLRQPKTGLKVAQHTCSERVPIRTIRRRPALKLG